jgi:glycosyltransferase involved in cell wall biosynthesis
MALYTHYPLRMRNVGDDISVILTTYNRPELAKSAFESVVRQTTAPLEIIVVEDASQTDIESWIANLGREDTSYVRHDSNRGLAAARNTGLRIARGDLIAYIDDDDEWLPSRLEAQLKRLRSLDEDDLQNLAALQVGAVILDRTGKQLGIRLPANQGNLRDSIIDIGAVTPSSSFLFVRSALESVGGFDETLINGIDHDVWMKLAVAGFRNEIIESPHVILYSDDRSTMMSSTDKRIAGLSRFIEKWQPTYEDWFGRRAGRRYAKRYFIGIISKLAGEKLANRRIREGLRAAGASSKVAGWRPDLQAYAAFCTLRSLLARAFPKLRSAKRVLFRQQPE